MMLYKTMALGLLESRPRLHCRLKAERLLLRTTENLAWELKAGHEAWTRRLIPAFAISKTSGHIGELLTYASSEERAFLL